MRTLRAFVALGALAAATVLSAQPAATSGVDEFTRAVSFGKFYFESKEYENAYEQFARADQLQPDNPAVLYDMALLLAKIGRFSEAQVKVDRYVQLYPGGVEKDLVAKLQLMLDFERDRQKKRQANQEYTDLFTKASFLYGRNELDDALKLFQDAEQRRPNDPAAVYDEAVVLEKQGDYRKAAERYRRYLELENDPDVDAGINQHIVALESELDDMETRIVCSFCGHKLPRGATWCNRCWRGPYVDTAANATPAPCTPQTTITRQTFFGGDRFNRNDTLPCVLPGTPWEALRYTPARQRSVQEARKAEGWSYDGEVIQGWRDRDGNEIRYAQGADYLEKIDSPSGGELLNYAAHKAGDQWLLDREDWFIDGLKYTSRFTFDADNHVARQQVDYQNTAACDHLITAVADYRWEGPRLTGAAVHGGYDGFVVEGSPRVDWNTQVTNSYDAAGHLVKAELGVTSATKVYAAKPQGPERDQVNELYPGWHVKRPITQASSDPCGVVNGRYQTNLIDLRPFYFLPPGLAIVVPAGIVRAVVTTTNPAAP